MIHFDKDNAEKNTNNKTDDNKEILSQAGNTLQGKLPALKEGEKYILEYKVKIDALDGTNGQQTINNNAYGWNNYTDSNDSSKVEIQKQPFLEKKCDPDANNINWTIKIHNADKLVGYSVDDILKKNGEPFSLPDSAEIMIGKGEGAVKVKFPFTITDDLANKFNNELEISYSLPIDKSPELEGTTDVYTNDVELKKDGDTDYKATSGPSSVKHQGYEISKTADTITHFSDHVRQNWVSNITVPNSFFDDKDLTNIYFTDQLLQPVCDQTGESYPGHHYIDYMQLNSIKVSCDGKELSPNVDYVVYVDQPPRPIKNEDLTKKFDRFEIEFKDSCKDKITTDTISIKYSTSIYTADLTHGTPDHKYSYDVKNQASIPKASITTDKDFEIPRKLVKMSSNTDPYLNGSFSPGVFKQDGVTIDYEKNEVYFSILFYFEKEDEDLNEITITDYMPDGVKCIHSSLKLYRYTNQNNFHEVTNREDNPKIKCEHNDENNTVTYTIYPKIVYENDNYAWVKFESGYYYMFTFKAELDKTNPIWNNPNEQIVTRTNKAVYKNDHKAETTFEVKKKVDPITKSGQQEEVKYQNGDVTRSKNVKYRVLINPGAEDLVPDLKNLTLTDQLSFAYNNQNFEAQLIENSIAVYEYDLTKQSDDPYLLFCGDPLNPDEYSYSYDSATNKLTFVIPDERALIITYSYHIDGSENSIDISNTATLTGVYNGKSENKISYKVEDSSATATTNALHIKKVDANDYSVGLPNATFNVYQHKLADSTLSDSSRTWELVTLENNITGADGYLNISDFLQGGFIYKIEEDQAPGNYEKTNNAYYLVCLSERQQKSNVKDQLRKCQKLIPSDLVDSVQFTRSYAYISIPNKRTGLSVEKKWLSDSGQEIPAPNTDPIQLQLLQQVNKESESVSIEINFSNLTEIDGPLVGPDKKGQVCAPFKLKKGSTLLLETDETWSELVLYLVEEGKEQNKQFFKKESLTSGAKIYSCKIDSVESNKHYRIYQVGDGYWLDGTVNLTYVKPYEVPGKPEPVCLPGYTDENGYFSLGNDGTWKQEFSNLPSKKDGHDIFYTVKEISNVDGYHVEYSANNEAGISFGILSVLNIQNPPILPETGGDGFRMNSIGYVLISASVFAALLKKLRDKESLTGN